MVDRPIIFSAPMVRALLDGRKTQTRRLIKPRGVNLFDGTWADSYALDPGNAGWRQDCIHYAVGDRLWVREKHYLTDDGDSEFAVCPADGEDVVQAHKASIERVAAQQKLSPTWAARHLKLRPSIHMPRWASRLTLLVTGVKVERLQEISEADAKAEGAVCTTCANVVSPPDGFPSYRSGFGILWNQINGAGAWDANPWVVAITFTVHRSNIDRMDHLRVVPR